MIKLTGHVGRNWEAMVRLACREQIGVGEYERRNPPPPSAEYPRIDWVVFPHLNQSPPMGCVITAVKERGRPIQDDDRLADDRDFRDILKWDAERR